MRLDLGGTSVRAALVAASGTIDRHGRKNESIAKNITSCLDEHFEMIRSAAGN